MMRVLGVSWRKRRRCTEVGFDEGASSRTVRWTAYHSQRPVWPFASEHRVEAFRRVGVDIIQAMKRLLQLVGRYDLPTFPLFGHVCINLLALNHHARLIHDIDRHIHVRNPASIFHNTRNHVLPQPHPNPIAVIRPLSDSPFAHTDSMFKGLRLLPHLLCGNAPERVQIIVDPIEELLHHHSAVVARKSKPFVEPRRRLTPSSIAILPCCIFQCMRLFLQQARQFNICAPDQFVNWVLAGACGVSRRRPCRNRIRLFDIDAGYVYLLRNSKRAHECPSDNGQDSGRYD